MTELRRGLSGDWEILTADGEMIAAANVVVATSAYQRPHIPHLATEIEPSVVQLHADRYRIPSSCPKAQWSS